MGIQLVDDQVFVCVIREDLLTGTPNRQSMRSGCLNKMLENANPAILWRIRMAASAVYRFRAMLPPFAGRNPNSRSDLVYRGQVKVTILTFLVTHATVKTTLYLNSK